MTDSPEPPIVNIRHCPACGANCEMGHKFCWLCSAPLGEVDSTQAKNPFAAREIPESSQPGATGVFDSVFLLLAGTCLALAVLVGVGLAIEEPGTLIPYLIIVGPAFAIPGVRALWRSGRGKPIKGGKLFVDMIFTFVMTLGIVAILILAAFGLLIAMCFSAISQQ